VSNLTSIAAGAQQVIGLSYLEYYI